MIIIVMINIMIVIFILMMITIMIKGWDQLPAANCGSWW